MPLRSPKTQPKPDRAKMMRDGVEERLVTYIVRSAVHRGRQITAAVLRAYADLLVDDNSEVSLLVKDQQGELDELLAESNDSA